MKKRSPIAVFLLPFVTFGIYSLVWMVKTKGEMVTKGAEIPTAWLIIIPFVNIWWLWKYSEGVGVVTAEKISGVLAFLLLFLRKYWSGHHTGLIQQGSLVLIKKEPLRGVLF